MLFKICLYLACTSLDKQKVQFDADLKKWESKDL